MLKKIVRTGGLILILTALSFFETTDFKNLDYERIPYLIAGCFISVLIKYCIIPAVTELKNKKLEVEELKQKNSQDKQ